MLETFAFTDPGTIYEAPSLFPPLGNRDNVSEPLNGDRNQMMVDLLAKPRSLLRAEILQNSVGGGAPRSQAGTYLGNLWHQHRFFSLCFSRTIVSYNFPDLGLPITKDLL